jgi:hypothetical protein
MNYYAGIGSRKTPNDVCEQMTEYAEVLMNCGMYLRSGGAEGADRAFEEGASFNKEIVLPRPDLPLWTEVFTMHFHPNPGALKPKGWQLMCRNAIQILGYDGNTPVDFVVCWTKDGKASSGTGQAIRIAEAFGIPVYNLKNKVDEDKFKPLLYELYKKAYSDEN